MLQEPLSPHDDWYSCNASLRKNSSVAVLEIVGPGFDASDLNRGDITPHEVLEVNCNEAGQLGSTRVQRTKLVDANTYRKSIRQRLVKIGKRAVGAFNIDKRRTQKELTDDQLVERAKKYLKREGGGLLIGHLEEYCPIAPEQLQKFIETLLELYTYRDSDLFQWRDEIVLSMSLLSSGKLVCWQIVWPGKQRYSRELI